MDIHLKDYTFDKMRIELTVQNTEGCKMILTAKTFTNEILWKTYMTDEFGKAKVYPSLDEALQDADIRMKSLA
jgi:hypothetical protein